LQYSREISIRNDSPEIYFHTVMKNITGHPIQWSMQTVSQYDTSDPQNPKSYNHEFWAFTPANPHSAYPGQYRVRSGLPNDPSFSVSHGWFTLHWMDLQSEVWIDSPGDWVAVVDGTTNYAMIEHFSYQKSAEYPGDASVIFYKNGLPPERKKAPGAPTEPPDPDDALLYMEAELNSPLVRLEPNSTYAMDTRWSPTRMGKDFAAVTDAGVVGQPLQAQSTTTGIEISASFGVLFSGNLIAKLYDQSGLQVTAVQMQAVSPSEIVNLHQKIKSPRAITRVSVHLIDHLGKDRGSLGEAHVTGSGGA
jgi:hypothetical protein